MLARSIILGTGATSALCAPFAVQAADTVRFASDVFVEKFVSAPGGGKSRILARADRLSPGDQVIFIVSWTARQGKDFIVTNPLPRTVAFQRSSDETEEVSVDGGQTWGRLEDLQVADRDGFIRTAAPEDVTHLRWRVPGSLALRGSGQITYRGIIR